MADKQCKLNCTIDGVPQTECDICRGGRVADKPDLARATKLRESLCSETLFDTEIDERLAAEFRAGRQEMRKKAADIVEAELNKCEDGVDVRSIQRLNRAWHAIRELETK
jgi:hypothetical protein